MQRQQLTPRPMEAFSLGVILFTTMLGFMLAEIAYQLELGSNSPFFASLPALFPVFVLALIFGGIHFLLRWRGLEGEQVLLPTVTILVAIGLMMIWRIMAPSDFWQQVLRGLLPGIVIAILFILNPRYVEKWLRSSAVTIMVIGLILLLLTLTPGIGVQAGEARLAIKIGPLPAIQTSELIKVALIIFLAWYMDDIGRVIHREARPILQGYLKLPHWRYFIPSGLFVLLAIGSLLVMKDLGAILILLFLFGAILYVGLETRVFGTVAIFGLGLFLCLTFLIYTFDLIPATVEQRVQIWRNPWSSEPTFFLGQEIPIFEGAGSQLQQAIYGTVAGGLTGTGLGFGCIDLSNTCISFVHSDLILAGIAEELGLMGILAVFTLFAILILRIFRAAVMLPPGQVFERLLLVGIGTHFFIQVFVMGAGTFKLIPLTGVTVPFLSAGGMALIVNVIEIGFVLALIVRTERKNDHDLLSSY